jgi:hypothetical protein
LFVFAGENAKWSAAWGNEIVESSTIRRLFGSLELIEPGLSNDASFESFGDSEIEAESFSDPATPNTKMFVFLEAEAAANNGAEGNAASEVRWHNGSGIVTCGWTRPVPRALPLSSAGEG